jgi:DUF971 family protein
MWAVASRNSELELATGDRVLRYPAVWLRDNCPCAECTDPASGQKLRDVTDVPADCAVTRAEMVEPGDAVAVTFAPDGHRSVYPRKWLAKHALDGYGDEYDGTQLWHTPPPVPEASWSGYVEDPATKAPALDAITRWGFVLLRDVPADPGMVLQVAESFGFVRETNYGRLFDVRIEPAPDNLAFTSREILPHTDNPYRDPVPTIQLLHCLRAADEGGDTGLVDGFAAAMAVQAMDRTAFEMLSGTTVRFAYWDKGAELRTSRVHRHREQAPAGVLRRHRRTGQHAGRAQPGGPVLAELSELFAGPGAGEYLGEPVAIGQHMLQAGALAEAAGADDTLVAAALLHDVGHLKGETDGKHGDQARNG